MEMEESFVLSHSKTKIKGRNILNLLTKVVKSTWFDSADQEVRAVERRVLLETLASQLPPETIKFSSKLKTIQSNANGDTQLELEDGSKLLAKVLFLSSKMTRNYMIWLIWLICLMYVF
ncbi:hypothetical protein YC2023_055404 [Brassica napus]